MVLWVTHWLGKSGVAGSIPAGNTNPFVSGRASGVKNSATSNIQSYSLWWSRYLPPLFHMWNNMVVVKHGKIIWNSFQGKSLLLIGTLGWICLTDQEEMGHMHESLKGRGTEEHLYKGSLGKKMIGKQNSVWQPGIKCMWCKDQASNSNTKESRKMSDYSFTELTHTASFIVFVWTCLTANSTEKCQDTDPWRKSKFALIAAQTDSERKSSCFCRHFINTKRMSIIVSCSLCTRNYEPQWCLRSYLCRNIEKSTVFQAPL